MIYIKTRKLLQHGWSRRHRVPLMGREVPYQPDDRRVNEDREEFLRISEVAFKIIQVEGVRVSRTASAKMAQAIPQWYRDLAYEAYSGKAYLIARTRRGKHFPLNISQQGGKPTPRDLMWLAKMEWQVLRAVNFDGDAASNVDDVDPAAYGDLWAGEFNVKENVHALLRCNGFREIGVPSWRRGHLTQPTEVSLRGRERELGDFWMGSSHIPHIQGRILDAYGEIHFGFIP